MHFAPVEQPPTKKFATQKNILSHTTKRNQIHLLINRADPLTLGLLRRLECSGQSIEENRTFIVVINTGKNLNEGRFTCPILTNKRMHFATFNMDRGI